MGTNSNAHHLPTKKVRTRTSEVWIDELGIGHVVAVLPNAEVSIEDSIESVEALISLKRADKRIPLFTDIRLVKSMDRSARNFVREPLIVNHVNAATILVGSILTRAIGNLTINLGKPPYPARIFTNEEQALNWLKQYCED